MSPIRLSLIAALLAAGGYGLHLHGRAPAVEAGETAAAAPALDLDHEVEEKSLRERFDLYRTLRLQDDIVRLYDMADPLERAKVDLPTFLSYYGHGMVRFDELQVDSIEFDWSEASAIVTATTSAQLLVDKLPRNYRMAQDTNAEDTKIVAPNPYPWVRRDDGQWYFRMDRQIVDGKTADGRGVQPL